MGLRINLSDIPEEIIKQYKLNDIKRNGYVYMEVQKGIYGLPQDGVLAYDLLVRRLARHGYAPCPTTTGLWKHHRNDVAFVLAKLSKTDFANY